MTHDQALELIQQLKPEKLLKLINSQENPKPIVFFDLETGAEKPDDCVDPTKAKICSISVIKLHLDGKLELKHKIVNPGIVMCDEVIEIHGITNEIAKAEPTFDKYAKGFAAFISDCDFAGFSSNKFDKPILARELHAAGVDYESIFNSARFIDVRNIYHHFNRRRLQDAAMRYLQKTMSDAHTSAYDSLITLEVMEAMLWEHETEIPKDLADIEIILVDNPPVDLFGKVVLNKDREPCFSFGKHKGKTVESVIGPGGEDVGYYAWMCKSDFHPFTLKVVSDLNNSFRRPKTPSEEAKSDA